MYLDTAITFHFTSCINPLQCSGAIVLSKPSSNPTRLFQHTRLLGSLQDTILIPSAHAHNRVRRVQS